MPKLCKPTHEAISNRIKAVYRHGRMKQYYPADPLPIWVFGLDMTKKTGILTMQELIHELKLNN